MRYRISLAGLFLFLAVFGGSAQSFDNPFAPDIQQFKNLDDLNPPPRDAIVFAGSSSFTLWQDVGDYFKDFTIINRGFGGSTLADQIRYASDIIIPYEPRQVVIYCGENDLASSDTITPDTVVSRFKTLFSIIRTKVPEAKITYVSMKPSPSRWYLHGKMTEANLEIRIFLEWQANASFVNVWDEMLDKDHLPDRSLFLDDMLHMNKKGYKIWQKAIEPHLIDE